MSLIHDDGQVQFHLGEAREVLRSLPAESVNTCVTSPPYWSLRDYGVQESDWGDWRGALGLEPTPALFIAHVVDVMREVRRVLRPDGTAWVNMGDSFAGSWGGASKIQYERTEMQQSNTGSFSLGKEPASARPALFGLKAKDKCLIPHRLGIALQDDGWWVRMDIIWAKPNPMPESVTDRPTQAHEFLWLLSKSERYYYDADAIREPLIKGASGSTFTEGKTGINGMGRVSACEREDNPDGRNKRSVWSIPTSPYAEAHFATFPPALVKPCILAGCPEGGTVLDVFLGSGTTAMVAKQLGRKAIGIDLNAEYLEMAKRRCAQMGLFA